MVSVSQFSSRHGIFDPEVLSALQRALDRTGPASEAPDERMARAARLLFSMQYGRSSHSDPDIAALLPVLRRHAFDRTRDRQSADDLVERTLAVALECAEAVPPEGDIADWLILLLDMSAVSQAAVPDGDGPQQQAGASFEQKLSE